MVEHAAKQEPDYAKEFYNKQKRAVKILDELVPTMDRMLKYQERMAKSTLERLDDLSAQLKVLNPFQDDQAEIAKELIKTCSKKDQSDVSIGGVLGTMNHDSYVTIYLNNEIEAHLAKRRQYWAEMEYHYREIARAERKPLRTLLKQLCTYASHIQQKDPVPLMNGQQEERKEKKGSKIAQPGSVHMMKNRHESSQQLL